MILKSRYIVPVDAGVIEDGGVVIKEGRIVAVGRSPDLDEAKGNGAIDYGDAVICPGFVNAHTHLELSLLAGLVPPSSDFIDWLLRLAARLSSGQFGRDQAQHAVRTGIAQSLSAGVTTVGDITRTPQWTREVLAESPLGGVSFGEVIAIGKRRAKLEQRLDAAVASTQTESLRSGISPHAPYSVEPDAMRACAIRARELNARLCIHLAESADEEPFTRSAKGRFADVLRDIGVWDRRVPASGCGPVELAVRTGVLGPRTVIAHANYISDEDISRIAATGASVAYCPRTHQAFGHPPHRFREMLAAGINVCVATDSLASNPSLSILDELRFVREHHRDPAADQLIDMGTLRGARALGLDSEVGSITPGKRADLCVMPLDDTSSSARWDAILESWRDPLAVYVSGERLEAPF